MEKRIVKQIVVCLLVSVMTVFMTSAVMGASAKTRITVWAYLPIDGCVEEFAKIHPEIEVDLVQMGAWDLHDKLLVSLAARVGAPDVVMLVTRRFDMFGPHAVHFTNLTELAEKHSNEYDLGVLGGVTAPDGEVYGMPLAHAPGLMHYRVDLVEEYGMAAPFETWDDVLREAEKITDADVKMMPMFAPGGEWGAAYYIQFLQSRGICLFDEKGNLIENNQAAKEMLKFYTDLVKNGIAGEEQFWTPPLYAKLSAGKYVVHPISTGGLRELKKYAAEDVGVWAVQPWPLWSSDEPPYSGRWGDSWLGVPKMSEQKEAAKLFVEFMTASVEGQIRFWREAGDTPHYLPAVKSDAYLTTDPYLAGDMRMAEAILARSIPTFYYVNEAEMTQILGSAIDAVFAGKMDVDKAWDSIEKGLERLTK